ncbi:MAG: hypothetical protein ABSC06_01450 [Rhodopila sp.]
MGPDGGIVDQDVDAAERGQCTCRHRLDLILLGHVGNNGDCLHAQGLGFVHDGLRLSLVRAGIDNDLSTFPGQFQHRGTPDTAARPGYQGDFPLKLPHEPLPDDNKPTA